MNISAQCERAFRPPYFHTATLTVPTR